MAAKDKANVDLAKYLRRRLQYLEQCNAEIEGKLSEDKLDLCRQIDEGVYSKHDPAIGKVIFHLEFIVGNTFRYTMLVGLCSFLEEALKEITERLVDDYQVKINAEERGNWLKKHISVLSTQAGVNMVAIQSDLDTFDNLIALRNCIVHAWGNVNKARNPTAVREAAKRIETAEISKDSFLVLGDQVVPEAIIAAENIVDSILTSRLNVSVT